jgi:uncharacterized protein YndB with AHSA1/START domain
MTDTARANESVVIERTFDAPLALIWQMWTDPEHFKAWYGPTGATIPVAEMDVRVGGSRFVGMEIETPAGSMQMWFTGEYLDVVENHRLVFTESMADRNGNLVAPAEMGMPPSHPTTTEVRVELEDVGGRTRLVLTHVGIPSGSPGEAGWVMAFEKLVDYARTQTGQ